MTELCYRCSQPITHIVPCAYRHRCAEVSTKKIHSKSNIQVNITSYINSSDLNNIRTEDYTVNNAEYICVKERFCSIACCSRYIDTKRDNIKYHKAKSLSFQLQDEISAGYPISIVYDMD